MYEFIFRNEEATRSKISDDLKNLAEDLFNQKKYPEAARKFHQLLASCSVDETKRFYLERLGVCYKNLKNYEKAIECLDESLAVDNKYERTINQKAATLYLQGEILLDEEKYPEAAMKFQQAIDLCTEVDDKKNYLTYLGICYKNMKNYSKACEFLDKALDIDNQYENARNNKADTLNLQGSVMLEQKYYEEAAKKFREAIDICTDNDENKKFYLGSLGNCYQSMGKDNDAIEWYDKALAIDSECEVIRNQKAETLIDQGKRFLNHSFSYSIALEKYKKAVELSSATNPHRKRYLTHLASCYCQLSSLSEASKYLDEALEIDDQYEFARNQKAEIMYKQGSDLQKNHRNYFEAIELFKKAYEFSKDMSRKDTYAKSVKKCKILIKSKGDSYWHCEQYENAFTTYEKLLEILDSADEGLKSQVASCTEETKPHYEAFESYELGLNLTKSCGDVDEIVAAFRNAFYLMAFEKYNQFFKHKYEEALHVKTKLKSLQLVFEKAYEVKAERQFDEAKKIFQEVFDQANEYKKMFPSYHNFNEIIFQSDIERKDENSSIFKQTY